MSIRLNKPYKIIDYKQKRYHAHYNIPAAASLIVPLQEFGEEASCDVRWENENGEMEVLHKKMFINENILPLNPLIDQNLFEIWDHYYNEPALI